MKVLRLNYQILKKDESEITDSETEKIVDELIEFMDSKGFKIAGMSEEV